MEGCEGHAKKFELYTEAHGDHGRWLRLRGVLLSADLKKDSFSATCRVDW